jgi:hypothetical protein
VIGRLQCTVVDCADAIGLARFYQSLLGGTVNQPDPRWATGHEFATLHTDSGSVLAFQRVEDYRAPQWPSAEQPQQFHLDIDVADVDDAHSHVITLGATLLRVDPRGWRVFADPAGHPFCLLRGGR